MMSRRRRVVAVLLLVAPLALAQAASAAAFTDRADFDAAIASFLTPSVVDFDALSNPLGSSFTAGGITFDSSPIGLDFFLVPNAPYPDGVDTTSPPNSLGVDAGFDPGDNTFMDGDVWSMSFAPVNAFGMYLITSPGGLRDGDITLTTDTGLSVSNSADLDSGYPGGLPDGGLVYFVGIVDAATPFAEISVDSGPYLGGGLFYTVDDVVTAIIPEPTTLAIWSLLGVLGVTVGWWRRSRKA